MSEPQLHLNLFGLGAGRHEAAWRHEAVDPISALSFDSYKHVVQLAERGKFDALFLADGLTAGPLSPYNARAGFEPMTLLAALAPVTEHIGLIATGSTTYTEPFNLARQFASIDQLSGGRGGWNIVTSSESSAAANFSAREHPAHADRYERAEEFVEVVLALWDSWKEGAIVADQASGIYTDVSKVGPIDFHGKHFDVQGPLNVNRSPQGRPLLVQAGSSDTGRTFGAKYADAIFTAQPILSTAQDFYADYKGRAKDAGRDPDSIKILPGICPVIGGTQAEAQALLDHLNELSVPEYGLASLKNITGLDLSGVPLDDPVPLDAGDNVAFQGLTSRLAVALELSKEGSLTVRQLLHKFAEGFGHLVVVGTPEQVADEIEHWFEHGAADGFNVMPPYNPGGLEAFVEHVVPELQRRGLFRKEYEGTTLREHYGVAS